MITVRDWLISARQRLRAAGFDAADLEAQLLAAHVLLVERTWLLAHPDEPFPALAGESVLSRRLTGEPLAYILGWREFYGRRFSVGPGVLIPRQETEILVEIALHRLSAGSTVLDLGTGSGCIAVTLKLEEPSLAVTACDISPQALGIAARNAGDLGAEVGFALSDGFEGLDLKRFDAIVTNPPYVSLGEPLAKEVAGFEPHAALYSGESGLEFYERLAREASAHLLPDGLLAMEVGYRQAREVENLFKRSNWRHLGTERDLSGTPRVVLCSVS